jgi:hypothetical protein
MKKISPEYGLRCQEHRGQCNITFYGRNLWIFIISKPFQPTVMFAGKAGAYLREASLGLGEAPCLT